MSSKIILRLVFGIFTMVAAAAFAAPTTLGPQLGLQSWTCRNMTFDQVVQFADDHGIKYVEFIAAHFDPFGSDEETLHKKALLDQHGLVAYSFGVNKTSIDKGRNRRLFEFAKLMGAKLIVVEPRDPAEWDNLEELVREYDIRLAIHNHGTGTTYGNPATVLGVLAKRDKRIGVCLDVGWVTAEGSDAAKVFRDYGDRVFDLHFKDKNPEVVDGKTVWVDTTPGEGRVNYEGLFNEIKRTGWSGVLAIETDSKGFAADPALLVTYAAKFFAAHFPTSKSTHASP